jgi:hypothetical protein
LGEKIEYRIPEFPGKRKIMKKIRGMKFWTGKNFKEKPRIFFFHEINFREVQKQKHGSQNKF